jgi:glutamate racemase
MTLHSSAPIGVFDSGLGGLTVLRELQKHVPERHYLYLGDNARCPYGTKGADTIRRYALECAHFLMHHGVGALVVACNTASAIAYSALVKECSLPIVSTIDPAVRAALKATKNNRIAVLCTNATCASGVYEAALRSVRGDVDVVTQPCPLFVPLVEAGMLNGEIVEKVIELYLADIRRRGVDTVILGCTHYPLLVESIRAFLGEGVAIVECGTEIAREIRALVGPAPVVRVTREDKYFVTDEVGQFNSLATTVLGSDGIQATKVDSLTFAEYLPQTIAS